MKNKKISIPVLMYHHVNPQGDFINVTPERFEAHMRYLSKNGFSTLHTGELLAILEGKSIPPKKPVMITFDDGWLDNWLFAFPVLKKHGIKAVLFVITSLIPDQGRRQRSDEGTAVSLPSHKVCMKMIEERLASEVMISWEESKEMIESGLIDIQSHTHEHKRYDKLYAERAERINVLKQDLKTSKKIIEEKTGKQCDAICWPWGKYDEDYVETARSLGYRVMFTAETGTNTTETDSRRVKRIGIGNIGLFTLKKKLLIHSNAQLSRIYLSIFKR